MLITTRAFLNIYHLVSYHPGVSGWLIKWKWGRSLTFTMIGYNNGSFQTTVLKLIIYTTLGRWVKIYLQLSEVFTIKSKFLWSWNKLDYVLLMWLKWFCLPKRLSSLASILFYFNKDSSDVFKTMAKANVGTLRFPKLSENVELHLYFIRIPTSKGIESRVRDAREDHKN